jgi:hypothetical protein
MKPKSILKAIIRKLKQRLSIHQSSGRNVIALPAENKAIARKPRRGSSGALHHCDPKPSISETGTPSSPCLRTTSGCPKLRFLRRSSLQSIKESTRVGSGIFEASHVLGTDPKMEPVRVKKIRHYNNPELRF